MKSLLFRMIIISFLILFAFSCEDMVWDNPNDANTTLDPSKWEPRNLQAQVLSDSQIKLTWIQDVKLIEGFRIERKEDGGSWNQIGEVAADVTQYIDTDLTVGLSYTYRVYAYATSNRSGYTTSNATSTDFPSPTNLTATTQNDTDIVLEWTDNCSFEEGFRVERQEDGGSWEQVGEVVADVTQYTDTGLTGGVYYFYRVFAFTANNVSIYSNIASFGLGLVTDIDGNVYQIVKIGDQAWMAENLKVTHYRNGDAIPNVTDNAEWGNLFTGAYCNYDNDVNYATTYGRLYNWYAVNDSRNIAPEGWHVPSDEEWKQLEMYLGMSQSDADDTGLRGTDEGGKMKETGTTHWKSPNTGATNESGFSALPGGCRNDNGNFYDLGEYAYFWCSSYQAWSRYLNYYYSEVYRYGSDKKRGFSVRCVRD